MDLAKTLEQIGLGLNEAVAYLALLQLGPSSVLAVARRAGLKRPTVYLILDDLIERGLVAIVPGEKKKLFLALPPERLAEEINKKSEFMRHALPELSALYRAKSERPSIQIFESREGMLNIYKEITESKAPEVLSFFSLEAVPPDFEESFEIFTRALKEKKIKLREIVYGKNKNHFYVKATKHLPNRDIRFTTMNYKFLTDNFIYGDKIALFSFKKRFALVIESEDVAVSLRSLFELAWQSAERI